MRRSKPAPQDGFFPGFTEVVEIGTGSLATVYRARELGTGRLVALKLLNFRDASPRALESFERESIALGAVGSHPNIVTLYRSLRAVDDRPVLVLELCQGSVGERLHNGTGLPVAEVVSLGIKIAGALETAHRAEILHRDVKPQNILITEFGEPALADFGVAMLQSSTQTTAGLFDFTTLHAAPELLEGGETSAATDVYELASSLYQLIVGRAAFRAYYGESPASVILRILRDPVQPLANTYAPAALSDLLVHAMSKDKGNRPPTAAEFAGGLAAVEVEQQWPRTQFLIRDASGGATRLPAITRLPVSAPLPPPSLPLPSFPPPSLPPPPTGQPLGGPPPVAVPAPAPGAAPVRANGPVRVIVERQVIERLVFEPAPAAPRSWSDISLVHPRPVDAAPAPEVVPAQYPIPPAGVPDDAAAQPTGGTVPTWAFRGATQVPSGPVSYADLALDPMSLRSRTTLRAGTASLVVADSGLTLRLRTRRSLIPWRDVLGFEPRYDEGGRDGQLVMLTYDGPVELVATRRSAGKVRDLHALLDAYRQRAVILGLA